MKTKNKKKLFETGFRVFGVKSTKDTKPLCFQSVADKLLKEQKRMNKKYAKSK